RIPIVGIGGITPANAPAVITAGACGIAVVSAVVSAPDPDRATRELLRQSEAVWRDAHSSSARP
ncbi:MAG TPA: thiamine phosphate synthase, partial [Longimicrobiaceae bacterium]|nr:thiamine phosphate synthase [Longimicrobiaceae bacterium]